MVAGQFIRIPSKCSNLVRIARLNSMLKGTLANPVDFNRYICHGQFGIKLPDNPAYLQTMAPVVVADITNPNTQVGFLIRRLGNNSGWMFVDSDKDVYLLTQYQPDNQPDKPMKEAITLNGSQYHFYIIIHPNNDWLDPWERPFIFSTIKKWVEENYVK